MRPHRGRGSARWKKGLTLPLSAPCLSRPLCPPVGDFAMRPLKHVLRFPPRLSLADLDPNPHLLGSARGQRSSWSRCRTTKTRASFASTKRIAARELTGALAAVQKVAPDGTPAASAHPARFSPDDKFSKERITTKKACERALPCCSVASYPAHSPVGSSPTGTVPRRRQRPCHTKRPCPSGPMLSGRGPPQRGPRGTQNSHPLRRPTI